MAKAYDLTGRTFGMLTVLGKCNERLGKKVLWLCQCECGEQVKCTTNNLTGGKSTSCGCVRTKHHGKGTRLYRMMSTLHWTGPSGPRKPTASEKPKNFSGKGRQKPADAFLK